jgi:RHS repeat-associated protein
MTLIARLTVALTAALLFTPASARAQTEEVVYYHTDAIGSVRATTDATGAVIERYDFLPFGEALPSTVPEARQFAGKERDTETGLDYFGARYHLSTTGRFTTVDPLMDVDAALVDPQRWNRYAYSLSKPFRYVDPDGKNPVLLPKLAELAQRAASSPAAQRAQQAIANQGTRAWVALTRLFNTSQGQELVQTAAELATGIDSGPGGSTFSAGIVSREFATGAGTVSMMAEAVISGKTLHLKDIAVYPKDASNLQVGTKGMLELLGRLKVEAGRQGFKELRITGLRFSGAKPGKEVDLLIDLREFR